MSIAFTPERWDRVRKTYGLWWEGTLERPILPAILQGRNPGRKKPELPLLSQANSADLSVPAKDIIDRIDYELSQNVYLGDSFPYFNMDCFGPGVAAAFLGAEVDNSTGRVWFHPKEQLPITELHFEYDPDNVWLNRVKEIYFEGMKRWQGQVLMGMTDLGGTMDILSTFRPSENLLLDLYDYPEEVKRLIGEISGLWKRLYQELNEVLQPINPGYSDWSQIYSCKPSYILQCDFSYMISPAMFDEFVKPELADMCRFLGNSFYHLDGVGQIPHLDSILAIKELNGVQWVPGDGKPTQSHWPDLYRRIQAAGKNSQLWEGFDGLETLISILGSSKGIHHTAIRGTIADEAEMRMKLSRYGAE